MIWNDYFVRWEYAQSSEKTKPESFLKRDQAWLWGKPPCWIIGNQRKCSLLSKQTWLQVVRILRKYNITLFFPLKTLPPWQPLCKHFVTGQRALPAGRSGESCLLIQISQRMFSAARALGEASLWKGPPNTFPVSCRLKLTKGDVVSLPFGRLIQT